MSVSAADKVFLCISLSGFGGVFVCLGIGLHLAYTKMDLMLDYLKNCPSVMNRTFFLNSGPLGRLFVLGGITGLMISPRLYLRDGGASADDLKNFPVDLKRKLIVLHWSTGFFLLVLFGLFAVDEFVLG
jgi:hypothetical protein